MLKSIVSLMLIAAALTISGCTSPPYESKASLPAAADGAPVVFIDKDLRRTLTVDNLVEHRTAAGLLAAQVALRNSTNDETLAIQVQTLFLAADGQALYTDVGNDSAWQNFTLTPGQTVYYKQNALTAEAQYYTVRVRYMSRRDAGN